MPISFIQLAVLSKFKYPKFYCNFLYCSATLLVSRELPFNNPNLMLCASVFSCRFTFDLIATTPMFARVHTPRVHRWYAYF